MDMDKDLEQAEMWFEEYGFTLGMKGGRFYLTVYGEMRGDDLELEITKEDVKYRARLYRESIEVEEVDEDLNAMLRIAGLKE